MFKNCQVFITLASGYSFIILNIYIRQLIVKNKLAFIKVAIRIHMKTSNIGQSINDNINTLSPVLLQSSKQCFYF